MKEKIKHKFFIKDWNLILREDVYGVVIDTVSDGRITFTFDTEKNEINVTGESVSHICCWDETDVLYHELPESDGFLKAPYICIDFENYNEIMVSSSIREIAWELDNMSRRDGEYDDDFDPDECDEE